MRVGLEALLMLSLATVSVLGLAGPASAQTHDGVSGTWSCIAHGTDAGDLGYTFNLAQKAEEVTGNFTAATPDGGSMSHDVRDGSLKNGRLELHFDDDEGTINVTGALDSKDAMKGDWSQGETKGTWECKRGQAAAPAKP